MDGWIPYEAIMKYCDESWLTDPVARHQVVRAVMALDGAEKHGAATQA